MMKKTVVLRMQPVDHFQEMNNLLAVLFAIPAVKQYADTHKLVNQKIFKNDCYEIVTDDNETVVYMNPDFVCA